MQEIKTPKLEQCVCGGLPGEMVKIESDMFFPNGYGDQWRAYCSGCNLHTNWCKSHHRAVCRWNTKMVKEDIRRNWEHTLYCINTEMSPRERAAFKALIK